MVSDSDQLSNNNIIDYLILRAHLKKNVFVPISISSSGIYIINVRPESWVEVIIKIPTWELKWVQKLCVRESEPK